MRNVMQYYNLLIYFPSQIEITKRCEPWIADPSLPQFKAAYNAFHLVYEVEPDMIRDGRSLFIVNSLAVRYFYLVILYYTS